MRKNDFLLRNLVNQKEWIQDPTGDDFSFPLSNWSNLSSMPVFVVVIRWLIIAVRVLQKDAFLCLSYYLFLFLVANRKSYDKQWKVMRRFDVWKDAAFPPTDRNRYVASRISIPAWLGLIFFLLIIIKWMTFVSLQSVDFSLSLSPFRRSLCSMQYFLRHIYSSN